jgi:hypothetical protein
LRKGSLLNNSVLTVLSSAQRCLAKMPEVYYVQIFGNLMI